MDKYHILEQYGKVEYNVSASSMTTMRVGGAVDCVVYPIDLVSLDQVINLCKQSGFPYKIIGKGSNLLFSDSVFHGVIIRLDKTFTNCYFDKTTCVVEAGCSLISVCYEAMQKGLGGLEFASGIPGTVGGAIFMNAGAYKSSMKDVVSEVLVYRDGNSIWMKSSELAFLYRSSIFTVNPDWIILAAKIQLHQESTEKIREIVDQRRERRMSTQPLNYPSAGSVFRNLDNMFAWQLIEQSGLRGKSIGGAQISEKHANFIVNKNKASAKDVMDLIELTQKTVFLKFNVRLMMEIEKFNW